MLQVDHDDKDHTALRAFNDFWQQHFATDSLLVFSTGRSRHLYEALKVCCAFTAVKPMTRRSQAEVPLLEPDVLICSVGTEIFWQSNHEEDAAWSGAYLQKNTRKKEGEKPNTGVLSQGWDGDTVRRIASGFPELAAQQDSEQRPFKASYHLRAKDDAARVLGALEQQLQVIVSRTFDHQQKPTRRRRACASRLCTAVVLMWTFFPTRPAKARRSNFCCPRSHHRWRACRSTGIAATTLSC